METTKKMKIDNNDKEANQSEPLPEDLILLNILPRFSIKSSIQHQLVSKQWRSFIKRSLFTRMHFSVSKKTNPSTFLLSVRKSSYGRVSPKWIQVDREAKTIVAGARCYDLVKTFNYSRLVTIPDVIGICDGVVGFEFGVNFLLYNPAIRDFKVVKDLFKDVMLKNCGEEKVNYLGFGSVRDEWGNVVNFKVLVSVDDVEIENQLGHLFVVYSLNTKTWRKLEFPSFEVSRIAKDDWVNLNGVLHWVAWADHLNESAFVLTFDIVNETLGKIKLQWGNEVFALREFGNFLSVVDDKYLGLIVAVVEGDETWLDNWILVDDGNKKLWKRAEKMIGPLWVTGSISRCLDGDAVFVSNGKNISLHAAGKNSDLVIFPKTGIIGKVACFEFAESFVSPSRIADQDDFQDID